MTREELLKALGVTDEQLRDFLRKYRHFLGTLDEPQRKMMIRSTPTLETAQKFFTDEVLLEDLLRLFESDDSHGKPVILCFPISVGPWG
jgi:carboxylesterase type B